MMTIESNGPDRLALLVEFLTRKQEHGLSDVDLASLLVNVQFLQENDWDVETTLLQDSLQPANVMDREYDRGMLMDAFNDGSQNFIETDLLEKLDSRLAKSPAP